MGYACLILFHYSFLSRRVLSKLFVQFVSKGLFSMGQDGMDECSKSLSLFVKHPLLFSMIPFSQTYLYDHFVVYLIEVQFFFAFFSLFIVFLRFKAFIFIFILFYVSTFLAFFFLLYFHIFDFFCHGR